MALIRKINYLFFLLFLSNIVDAQEIKFKHLALEDGLLHNTTTAIIQDSKGFIWIGTYCGLHRYDGSNFKIYTNSKYDTTTISSNNIKTLYEDRDKNIWVGCYKGGLNKFNIETERFEHIKFSGNKKFNEALNNIISITQDNNGLIWFANEVGIFSYDPYKAKFVDSFTDFVDSTITMDVFVPSPLVSTVDNKILFSVGGIAYQIDAEIKKVSKLKGIENRSVSNIALDPTGNCWITSLNNISQFSTEKGITKTYNVNVDDNFIINSLLVGDSLIWVGTYGNGLVVIDRITGEQDIIVQSEEDPFSLISNKLNVIYKDKVDGLWLGTVEGISIYHKENSLFNNVLLAKKLEDVSNDVVVTSIEVDKFGNRWFGTQKYGVVKFDIKQNKYSTYKHNPNNNNSIASNSINSLCFDDSGYLYISSNNGLTILDPKSNRIWNFSKYSSNSSLPAYILTRLFKDSKGNIWAGSFASGLLKFSFKNEKISVSQYLPEKENKYSLSTVHVTAITEDKKGNIWVGTFGGGLNKLEWDKNSGRIKFTNFKADQSNHNSILSNDILSLFVDEKNSVWIGTANMGVSVFNQQDSSFSSLTIDEGLSSNIIYSITEDQFNHIWISTNKGLSRINLTNNSILNYTNHDGFLVKQFHLQSFAKVKDSCFIYGGKKGVICFNTSDIVQTQYTQNIYLTELAINGKSVKVGEEVDDVVALDRSILDADEINLSYNTSLLTLAIADIQYGSTSHNIYMYKLEGLDNDWRISDSKNHQLIYTNLDPGKYILKIKYVNFDNAENLKSKSVLINVSSPFWETWWFSFLVIVLFGAFLLLLHRLRTKRINNYANQLKMEVDERTSEITKVNQNLQKVNDELSEFAYIVSHDLKAPLRGIGQLATWIVQDNAKDLDSDGKDKLNMLVKRVTRMNALIEGMLQYSRAGKVTKDLMKIDINSSVFEVVEFLALPESVKINVSANIPIIMGEKLKVEQAIQNIINNSVRFCDKEICEISIKSEVTEKHISIIFEDNGPGIDTKYHEKIFGIFQTLGSKEESTGIGLSIVKKVMQRHNGKVSVISPIKDNRGTAIILSFNK